MFKTIVLTLGLSLTLAAAGNAQKFGYCNSVALLAELPEVKEADKNLEDFQTQLQKRGQQMVQELQTKANDLQRKKDQGTISPKDFEEQAAKLGDEEAKIKEYEQQVYADLGKKREEIYQPILDKVNKAMADVAKENGFMLIFDTSTNVLLFADDTLDVTKLVKAKLGIAN